MKIEVGMYFRFKKGKITYVRQLLEVIHNYEEFNVYRTVGEYFDYEEKDYFDIVYPDEIIGKPSYKIIDLIEEGDYINGHQVYEVDRDCHRITLNGGDIGEEFRFTYLRPALGKNMGIKSIVTHEQFESMKYEVE